MLGLVVGVAAVLEKLRQAADKLGTALGRPPISLSGPPAKSTNNLSAKDSWTLCTDHPWQKLPVCHYSFLLATPSTLFVVDHHHKNFPESR